MKKIKKKQKIKKLFLYKTGIKGETYFINIIIWMNVNANCQEGKILKYEEKSINKISV